MSRAAGQVDTPGAVLSDEQRAEILAAARRRFLRSGFHHTSLQDVFAEAGKSAGAVYVNFPRREDMIVGVAAQNLDDVTEVLHVALTRDDGERAADLVEQASRCDDGAHAQCPAPTSALIRV